MTSAARAEHPLVAQGIGHYEAAELPQALEAFSRAEAAEDLTRDDLARVLRFRALIAFANGDSATLSRTALALAVLASGFEAADPPPLHAALVAAREELRGGLGIRILTERAAAGRSVIRAVVDNDQADLTRRVELYVLRDGAFARAQASETEVDDGAGELLLYARAVGPGGVVLAQRGSPEEPVHLQLRATPAALVSPPRPSAARPPVSRQRGSSSTLWWWAGAGAAIAVAATVAAFVLLPLKNDDTYVENPTVEF